MKKAESLLRITRKHGIIGETIAKREVYCLKFTWKRMELSTVGRVAAAVGIPELAHFYKAFKAFYGVTPKKYKEMHNGG